MEIVGKASHLKLCRFLSRGLIRDNPTGWQKVLSRGEGVRIIVGSCAEVGTMGVVVISESEKAPPKA